MQRSNRGAKLIQVWDPFIRIFHWSLVAIVVANRFLNESGGDWHARLGYIACIFIVLRLLWSAIGPRYARWSEIARTWPKRGQFLGHIREYSSGRTPRYIGHPPMAIIGMVSMLICVLGLGATGWMMSWDQFFGEEWLEELHGVTANVLMGLAILHIIGVVRESILHRENLILGMIHGKKRGSEE